MQIVDPASPLAAAVLYTTHTYTRPAYARSAPAVVAFSRMISNPRLK